MPRNELENTMPVRVRISNADLARIKELFKYVGIHGHISDVIRKGARIQIFLEEVLRERVTVGDDVKSAIHTLQAALDRRDRDAHDQGEVAEAGGTEEEESSNGKKASSKKRRSKKPKTRQAETTDS